MELGARDRKQFEEDGYLVVRNLITGNDLVELDRMIDRLLDGELNPETDYQGWMPEHFYTFWEPEMKDRTDKPRRERVRLMSNMFHHHRYFRAIGSHHSIYEVISFLFQSGVQMFSDTVFMKPAHHGIEAAMHQDTSFWPNLEPNAMNFWLAIDPATVENGCLHLIPGSHTVDLPHHNHPIQGNLLYENEVEIEKLIPIEMDSGDGIFFNSGLVHKSFPNRSDHSRRAYAAVYGAENLRHLEPWKLSTLAGDVPDYNFELIEPPIGAG